jgi:hypothetical protein
MWFSRFQGFRFLNISQWLFVSEFSDSFTKSGEWRWGDSQLRPCTRWYLFSQETPFQSPWQLERVPGSRSRKIKSLR